jgi:hypothetical protein
MHVRACTHTHTLDVDVCQKDNEMWNKT